MLLHRATLGTLVLRFRSTRSDRGTALSAQCAAGYRARARGMEESPLSTELYRPPLGENAFWGTPEGTRFKRESLEMMRQVHRGLNAHLEHDM